MQQMNDKEMMNDSIASQKLIGRNYHIWSDECVNQNLKQDFLTISKEESDITGQIFSEMEARGWVTTDPADPTKVTQSYQKFRAELMQ